MGLSCCVYQHLNHSNLIILWMTELRAIKDGRVFVHELSSAAVVVCLFFQLLGSSYVMYRIRNSWIFSDVWCVCIHIMNIICVNFCLSVWLAWCSIFIKKLCNVPFYHLKLINYEFCSFQLLSMKNVCSILKKIDQFQLNRTNKHHSNWIDGERR